MRFPRQAAGRAFLLAWFGMTSTAFGQTGAGDEWVAYGGDPGGSRYSRLAQINRSNVGRLTVAWTYRTGEMRSEFATKNETSLEVTPLMVDGTVYASTPLGRVVALDPDTGQELWTFDPRVDRSTGFGDFTNRGVATWVDRTADPGATCRRRIFVATIDARLIVLDASTGRPCRQFGTNGTVDLRRGLRIEPFETAAYQVTSPPTVAGDLVIVGSAIADNSRLAPASGEVRAFDARTGALRWSWDPIPQDPADPAFDTWGGANRARTGAANVWSVMSLDAERGLLLLPTSSPAPDYFGGFRKGTNRYANSVVALRASTGERLWDFQTVHHDIWDYDNPAPPTLAEVERNDSMIPVVLQATKTGQLFILHRETGEPVFPVEERPVPPSSVPGEEVWPTQPFTTRPGPSSPHRLDPSDVWGVDEGERRACRARVAGLRNEGIFTPPSTEGTLVIPSNIGGAHWGGVAIDPARSIAVVPVNRLAAEVQLIPNPGGGFDEDSAETASPGYEYTTMEGTGYVMRRRLLVSPRGLPCTPPPFGALVAVSLRSGRRLWSVPLGALPGPDGDGAPGERSLPGSPNLGGPIVTAGGLIFIAATLDRRIRAFDIETGEELWGAELPAGGKATPMTYRSGDSGRQYVLIAAGGGGRFGRGDHIVAFSLRE